MVEFSLPLRKVRNPIIPTTKNPAARTWVLLLGVVFYSSSSSCVRSHYLQYSSGGACLAALSVTMSESHVMSALLGFVVVQFFMIQYGTGLLWMGGWVGAW